MEHYGDNFIPIVPSDYLEHDLNTPFCWNDGCICREDQAAIDALNEAYQGGLVTSDERDTIYHGRTV
jgi:hypothetical protein